MLYKCFRDKVFDFLTLRNVFRDKAVELIYADFSKMPQPAVSCSVEWKNFDLLLRKRRQAFSFFIRGSGPLTGYWHLGRLDGMVLPGVGWSGVGWGGVEWGGWERIPIHLYVLFFYLFMYIFSHNSSRKMTLRKHAYSYIYIENFTSKNWKFSDKKNSVIFHISAQNIDCGYSLEPPRRGGSNGYPQSMFLSRYKKNNVYPCKPQFYYIKVGFKGVKII